ncbi:ArsJ-associated glyceraldehyde-3-phosphate dehydrogenase [Gammaproteobacteria bacterium]|jgi:glyceraldehyde 3-phosphate dehydrogenase|nr:ArsJ-associated glyceraldehyde-3-phosphate dehydrogenase [Gammaproteobacteria bacterium]|tara:strand:- start:1213 stop:2220 length:1008 start_codon:yes stop_codon:yes gene_type:complete
MAIRVGINGFGRIGRLAMRVAWDSDLIQVVHVNEIAGNIESAAHLIKFDSIHGTWGRNVSVCDVGKSLIIDGSNVSYSQNWELENLAWFEANVDLVIDCTGKFKSQESLAPYFQQGVNRVVVSAPMKDETLNVVMGINDHLYADQPIVSAASCTTNCLAPVIDVLLKEFGIKHASITTIHDLTNTQSVLDEHNVDLRRARASSLSLIPTSTGSATAITRIFPELAGCINGLAVRVPLANASLTDCVFELKTVTTKVAVNTAFKIAAESRLSGILGFEELPLVSADYTNDSRSGIVDGLSTMVINGTQLKVLIWYDNEMGYVHRMMELTEKVALSM